jgi:hypothetical protein
VLADPSLFIATRGAYLNVYWCGQSLFLVTYHPIDSKLTVTTHPKFLLDPLLEKQVPLLEDGSFGISDLQQKGFFCRYGGPPVGATLDKMKTAAVLFSGPEKVGCHEIAINKRTLLSLIAKSSFPFSWARRKVRALI